MAQFHAYANPNRASARTYPYLLDIQANLLDVLRTTVIVPLSPFDQEPDRVISRLTPIVQIGGRTFLAEIPQLAAMDRQRLGAPVADLSSWRAELTGALDFLISGV